MIHPEPATNVTRGDSAPRFASTPQKQAIQAAFAPATAKGIATRQELEKLRELRTKDTNLAKMESGLTYDAARLAYRQNVGRLADQVAAGEGAKFDGENGWTPQDWQEDFQERRKIVRAHRSELTAQAWPIVKEIRARWAAAANDLAAEVEAQEKTAAERFAVAYVPGLVPSTIRKAAGEMVDTHFTPAGGTSFDEMLPLLKF